MLSTKCKDNDLDDEDDEEDDDNGRDDRNTESNNTEQKEKDSLGPLPLRWEKAFTENGETYFIDHNTGTSHWLDPRLSKFQKKSLEDCLDDELPYGWEKIHDSQYGTYFIDHVNRRTQYENPVLEAKRRAERDTPEEILRGKLSSSSTSSITATSNNNGQKQLMIPSSSSSSSMQYLKLNDTNTVGVNNNNNNNNILFTRDPMELRGDRIITTLLKSSRGLGFTIVGGDDTVDEFLQIKSIVPNGPAWLNGKLKTGDLLVYVNEICVLGFTHHEMVNVFQSILAGETVTLDVCRGYPLPFDPDDTNTDIITTIAVDTIKNVDFRNENHVRMLMGSNVNGNYNYLFDDLTNEIQRSPTIIDENNNNNNRAVHFNNCNDIENDENKDQDKGNDNHHSYCDDNNSEHINNNNDKDKKSYDNNNYSSGSSSTSSNHNNNNNNKYVLSDGTNLQKNVMGQFQKPQQPKTDIYSNNVKSTLQIASTPTTAAPPPPQSAAPPTPPPPPEILNIRIAKGLLGFGFTIADSAHGQKVKKILERNCCKNLLEGDLLLAINNHSLNQMSHTEVVQVLKDCPKCQEAIFQIQRSGQYLNGGAGAGAGISGSGTTGKINRRSGDGTRFNGGGIPTKTTTTLLQSIPVDLCKSKSVDFTPVNCETTSQIVPTGTANGATATTDNVNDTIEKNAVASMDNQNVYDYMNNDSGMTVPLPNQINIIQNLKDNFSELSINTTQQTNHHHHHHHHNHHLQDDQYHNDDHPDDDDDDDDDLDSKLNNLCHPMENIRNDHHHHHHQYIGSIMNNHRSTDHRDIYYDEYKQHQQQQQQHNYSLSNRKNTNLHHLSILTSQQQQQPPPLHGTLLPIIAPVPTYYQDCFCCDCQECYRRMLQNQQTTNHQDFLLQKQPNNLQYPMIGQHQHSSIGGGVGGAGAAVPTINNSTITTANSNQLIINNNRDMQNRIITDYMIDRRKTGFCPLEIEQQQQQQHHNGGSGSISSRCSDPNQTQSQLMNRLGSMEQHHSTIQRPNWMVNDGTEHEEEAEEAEDGSQHLPSVVGHFISNRGYSVDYDPGITTGD